MSSGHILPFVVPDRQLIGHHDLVISVGHQQPDGVLKDALDKLLLSTVSSGTTAAPCWLLARMVVLRRVDAAEVLAGVAATWMKEKRCKNLELH